MCVSLIRNSRSNGCFFCGLTLAVLGNGVSITAAGRREGRGAGAAMGGRSSITLRRLCNCWSGKCIKWLRWAKRLNYSRPLLIACARPIGEARHYTLLHARCSLTPIRFLYFYGFAAGPFYCARVCSARTGECTVHSGTILVPGYL